MTEPRLPPIAPLLEILGRLERAGLPHALGGSGLLAALGLAEVVHDWDVTVDADADALEAACAGGRFTRHGNSGCHADHKLTFPAERVELIARFAFFVPDGTVAIPTVVTGRWRGVPVGSPLAWAVAYRLLGDLEDSPPRRERAERLFRWIDRHGADEETLARLAGQPLPDAVRARLAGIRIAGAG